MTREHFTELLRTEQESLRRFLLGLCVGNREEAEEIAQQAMIKAFLASDRYVEKCSFSTWLFKIAYNTFLDHIKSRKQYTEPDERIPGGREADDAFRYEALYRALGEIPEKERSAVLLYYIKGYSIKEIANISGASENAVKTRLSRGRDELRKRIEP